MKTWAGVFILMCFILTGALCIVYMKNGDIISVALGLSCGTSVMIVLRWLEEEWKW